MVAASRLHVLYDIVTNSGSVGPHPHPYPCSDLPARFSHRSHAIQTVLPCPQEIHPMDCNTALTCLPRQVGEEIRRGCASIEIGMGTVARRRFRCPELAFPSAVRGPPCPLNVAAHAHPVAVRRRTRQERWRRCRCRRLHGPECSRHVAFFETLWIGSWTQAGIPRAEGACRGYDVTAEEAVAPGACLVAACVDSSEC